MIVIADTSPISYLVSIGEIDILPNLYGQVLVPPSASDELRHPRAPEAVRSWVAAPPAWFEVRAPGLAPDEEQRLFVSARVRNDCKFAKRRA